MKIISWNVNSIRQRYEHLLLLLKEEDPDIVYLQETKVNNNVFPTFPNHYTYYMGESTGRNGVAIFSKKPLELVGSTSRYIHCKDEKRNYISIYAPNGFSESASKYHKIEFYNFLHQFSDIDDLIIGGDFNTIPNNMYSTIGNPFSREEIESFHILKSKFVFFDLQYPHLSWWDYRLNSFNRKLGMGLDFFMLSQKYIQYKHSIPILSKYRAMIKPSDHAPVLLNLENIGF